MKILISGASGLVGGNCMREFKANTPWNVVGTYFSYQAKDTVYFDTLDLKNKNSFDAIKFNPDVILHCGALTFVDYCEDHEEESFQKTVNSTQNIIDLCRTTNAKMVFISTDYIFDGKDGPYDEESEPNALSVYGRHKLTAENRVREQIENHIILRITNVYGDEERGKNFVARILAQILEGKKLTLKLPSDQYATPINAHDIARALLLLLTNKKRGIYNIASSDYMNRVQLSQTILKYFPKAEYDMIPMLTEDMNQPADRPLQGGLKAMKFLSEYPTFRFTTVDEYVQQFVKK